MELWWTDDLWSDPPPRPHPRTPVNAEPPRRVPNAVRSFWVADPATGSRRQIDARLRVQTSVVAMWVEVGVWHDVRELEQSAAVFEEQIYPGIHTTFGSEWRPGIDNDPRVHILHATGLGENVSGYTASIDQYPQEMHPLSNEAEMMVVNLDRVGVGEPAYNALLARQLQRLVQWNQNRNQARWLKEGLAELAVALSGFDVRATERSYPPYRGVSLIHWTDETSQRQAVYLFAVYFHQLFGDEGTRILMAESRNGIRGIDAVLRELEGDRSFEDLFADWLAANYLDHTSEVDELHRAYTDLDLDKPTPAAVPEAFPFELETTVEQFGADYIILRGDADLTVRFTGELKAPVLSVVPYSGGRAWWSSRADESLTTLTRSVDLSAVAEATLLYRAWYDIELNHDYATVEARTADDEEWTILVTPSGTDADPYGNSPGWSYTGKSPGWIREEIDLSQYAGQEVFLRFSYLTDGAITGEGFLLDHVSIPEIGYSDDMETDSEFWKAEGFLRIAAHVPQRYLALVILRGEETVVERLTLEGSQRAAWTIPLASENLYEAVLIVSGTAPLSTEPAPYRLTIEP